MNSFVKQVLLWTVLLVVAVLALWQREAPGQAQEERDDVADFESALAEGRVKKLEYSRISEGEYSFEAELDLPVGENRTVNFRYHEFPTAWETALREQNGSVEMRRDMRLGAMLINVAPFVAAFAVAWSFRRRILDLIVALQR